MRGCGGGGEIWCHVIAFMSMQWCSGMRCEDITGTAVSRSRVEPEDSDTQKPESPLSRDATFYPEESCQTHLARPDQISKDASTFYPLCARPYVCMPTRTGAAFIHCTGTGVLAAAFFGALRDIPCSWGIGLSGRNKSHLFRDRIIGILHAQSQRRLMLAADQKPVRSQVGRFATHKHTRTHTHTHTHTGHRL